MSPFNTASQADAFALRCKSRDFTDGDIEAVWPQAHRELRREGVIRASRDRITERCIKIMEERA